MKVWEADLTAIMPLSATRSEIDATDSLLMQLDRTWPDLFTGAQIDTDGISQLILVGSGDSWAAALVAAAWIEENSQLRCVARQTFEFLNSDVQRYGRETLIVVISASGRPSPVTDALRYALSSSAQVVGVTNNPGSPFSLLTENMLFTGAQKKGMPTQSTSATLYLLLRLVDYVRGKSTQQGYFYGMCNLDFQIINREWHFKEISAYWDNNITLLGSNKTWGLALAGSNLLSCGPQIRSNAFLVEEFHHSLRLNQVQAGEHFILLPSSLSEVAFYQQTFDRLVRQGATAEYVEVTSSVNGVYQIFRALQYFYEMSWHLAADFVDKGGNRVSLQGLQK